MQFFDLPVPPFGFRNLAWKGAFTERHWTATLSHMDRRVPVAKLSATPESTEVDVDILPGMSGHWEDFTRRAMKAYPDLSEASAQAAAIEDTLKVAYADRRLAIDARRRTAYRLKGDNPLTYRVMPSLLDLNGIGELRLAFGEQIERIYASPSNLEIRVGS